MIISRVVSMVFTARSVPMGGGVKIPPTTLRQNFRTGWAISTIFEAFDTKVYPTLDRNVWNMKPDIEHKWRRQNRRAHNSSYMREINQYIGISTAKTHIFGIWHSNKTIENVMWLDRKFKFQDGDHKTRSKNISARRPVSNEIPTATPMFQGSSIHMGLTTIGLL